MASLKETSRDAEFEKAKASPTVRPEENRGEHHPSMGESIHESAVSHDKPMERKAPEAPFALVGLAYFAVLAVIGLIIGIVLFALS